ncbi:unannotated protein [freshwater metagenome]|uniref:Unannotated protein n=1 Tax=freshwater metagenome TaxID=449393 RepID=A0A6J6JW82_9ZZZZ
MARPPTTTAAPSIVTLRASQGETAAAREKASGGIIPSAPSGNPANGTSSSIVVASGDRAATPVLMPSAVRMMPVRANTTTERGVRGTTSSYAEAEASRMVRMTCSSRPIWCANASASGNFCIPLMNCTNSTVMTSP